MNRRKAVILVSFGTVTLSCWMPNETKQILMETFESFPDVTFIWKYENDEHRIANGHANVITSKWIPQFDLLGNFNMRKKITYDSNFNPEKNHFKNNLRKKVFQHIAI